MKAEVEMEVKVSNAQAGYLAQVLMDILPVYYKAHPEEDARIREEIRRREEAECEEVSN